MGFLFWNTTKKSTQFCDSVLVKKNERGEMEKLKPEYSEWENIQKNDIWIELQKSK